MAARPRTILAVLVGAHVVNDFYSTVLPAFLPGVADEFDLDYTGLGVLSFAFILLTGVLQPVIGSTADRSGRRRWFLVFGFIVGAVGFVSMAMAPSFWILVAVSLLCGLGGATYHPQATAFIVAAYSNGRGRALGIHGWGGSVGHFLAPIVAVLLVAALDWRLAMALIAIPLTATAVLIRTKLRETPPCPGVTLRGAVTRPLLLVAITFGVISMVGRSFLTFFVKMLTDEGWSQTTAGAALTVVLLAGTIAQPLGGWLFDRLGGRTVFMIAATATTALVGLFALTTAAPSLIAIAGIAFFGLGLFPVALALASQLAPATHTGAATGIVFGVSGLMIAATQPAVGALATAVGDIRVALVWQLPLAILGLVLASKLPANPVGVGAERAGIGHQPVR